MYEQHPRSAGHPSTGDHKPGPVLISGAQLLNGRVVDVLIAAGRVVDIQAHGAPFIDVSAQRLDAGGGLLLPGLHDHHIHVPAAAAAMASVRCGPPEITTEADLEALLAAPGSNWLRGIGYHESIAGMLDRAWLDRVQPSRPVRVQHRGGRMWAFNSAGLDRLLESGIRPPPELDLANGQLLDADSWLRVALGSTPPPFDAVGRELARYGVTGITDMTPANDVKMAWHFAAEQQRGALPQQVVLAGQAALEVPSGIALGPVKVHLHEPHLPDFSALVGAIRSAHQAGRGVAVHCVTETELVFALAAWTEARAQPGDRIEHASVTPDTALEQIASLGLAVVAQPHFVFERGDAYLADIAPAVWPHLYRLRAFVDRGIVLAGGSDAPFGEANPWAAMAAAVDRRTRAGCRLEGEETLTPEQALSLFLADPLDLGSQRRIEVGAPANLCLLSKPWREARRALSAELVRAVCVGGRLVHQGVDQPPLQCGAPADPLA